MESHLAIGNVTELPGAWIKPELLVKLDESQAGKIADEISPKISNLLSCSAQSHTILEELFHEDSFWRDQVALT